MKNWKNFLLITTFMISASTMFAQNNYSLFSYSMQGGCDSALVTFTNNYPDARATYLWDFGNGQTSTNPNASPVGYYTGDYYASLTMTGNTGLRFMYDIRIDSVPNDVYPTVTERLLKSLRMKVFDSLGTTVYESNNCTFCYDLPNSFDMEPLNIKYQRYSIAVYCRSILGHEVQLAMFSGDLGGGGGHSYTSPSGVKLTYFVNEEASPLTQGVSIHVDTGVAKPMIGSRGGYIGTNYSGNPRYYHTWYKDGQLYQVGDSIKCFETGIYYVSVKDHATSCTANSDEMDFTVGVNDLDNSIEYSIYPNPSKGFIYVNAQASAKNALTIEITNICGQKVYQETFKENLINKTYDLSGLPKGTYFIRFANSDESYTKKLILY